jgi:hypothetical protein
MFPLWRKSLGPLSQRFGKAKKGRPNAVDENAGWGAC